MSRWAFRKEPDAIIAGLLLIHVLIGFSYWTASGWIQWCAISGGAIFLVFAGLTFFGSSWLSGYYRYALLAGILQFIPQIWNQTDFKLAPILHMLCILIFAALYLEPAVIWFVSICCVPLFYLASAEFDTESLILTAAIGFASIFALHKICMMSRQKISQIRRMEREMNFEQIGQQQHLATIGQIAASIAHDIRNPLTSIQGFIQLIEKNERRENFLDYYRIIRSEISRIDTLIREVLMLSKSHTIDADSMRPVRLSALLDRLVLLMEPDAIKSNIQIRSNLDEQAVVVGSEEKLQQVVMNMMRNAFEAIGEHGTVDVELGVSGSFARITIGDSGPGVPEDKMDNLFTPFYTTKESGTGLGLSICQSIIKAHGGMITVINRAAGGAEFTISLPLSDGTDASAVK